jgi:hypothetical protein
LLRDGKMTLRANGDRSTATRQKIASYSRLAEIGIIFVASLQRDVPKLLIMISSGGRIE